MNKKNVMFKGGSTPDQMALNEKHSPIQVIKRMEEENHGYLKTEEYEEEDEEEGVEDTLLKMQEDDS